MVRRATVVTFAQTAGTWTAMPAALTEYYGNANRRLNIDSENFTQWRMKVGVGGVAGIAGAVLGLQFSTDGGTTWFGADNGTSGANSTVTCAIDITINTAGPVTAWTTLHENARIADCLYRIVGVGGNGAANPAIPHVNVQFK